MRGGKAAPLRGRHRYSDLERRHEQDGPTCMPARQRDLAPANGQTCHVREEGNGWREVVTAHLPLILTLGGFAVAVLRIGSASAGDPTIASELLVTLSLQPFLMSTFLYVLPLALFVLFVWWPRSRRIGTLDAADTLLVFAVLVAVPLLPAIYMVGVLVFLVPMALLTRRGTPRALRWRGYLLLTALLLPAVGVAGSRNLWLPPQAISVAGSAPRTGYVLSSDDRTTVVLYDTPRELGQYPTVEATFCTLHEASWLSRPLVSFDKRTAKAPPLCPAPES